MAGITGEWQQSLPLVSEGNVSPPSWIGVRGELWVLLITNYIYVFLFFFLYGSWGPLDRLQILPRGTPTFSTPGKAMSSCFWKICVFLCFPGNIFSHRYSAAAIIVTRGILKTTTTKKCGCLVVNSFFTIGPQTRDLSALLPGNDSYGRPASFRFSCKCVCCVKNTYIYPIFGED